MSVVIELLERLIDVGSEFLGERDECLEADAVIAGLMDLLAASRAGSGRVRICDCEVIRVTAE